MSDDKIPVRVALRSRPLSSKELSEGCRCCIKFVPCEPQVVVGKDKAFTFDFVFEPDSRQETVYEAIVKPLVENIFKGYNATILAYGQTGSGKTHTMGTYYTNNTLLNAESVGIIPRAIQDIFNGIQTTGENFTIKVTFLEIYNEDVLDLLTGNRQEKVELQIREDRGEIKVCGLQEIPVTNIEETMACLERGSLSRTTGATAMNLQSSRSHAIFTIHIEQHKPNGIVTSKFHLVDLAGSERAKKTQAQGGRFKEGVSINLGLLALGNVISALCEEGLRNHVPYRDSKLTRLLQDSLGGNSHTAMIACVSPADSNLEETVNTLRYADRARKIKNKPIVNRDPHAAEIARLKQEVLLLKMQTDGTSNGKDLKTMQELIRKLGDENKKLAKELQWSLSQTTTMYEKALKAEQAREKYRNKLNELLEQFGMTFENLNMTIGDYPETEAIKDTLKEMKANLDSDADYCGAPSTSPPPPLQSDGSDAEADNTEFGELHKEHVWRQAEMNRELNELNHVLKQKEELAKQILDNDGHFSQMQDIKQVDCAQLEEQIHVLLKEKESYLSALRVAQSNPSSKISEQRRKRLQELETQIMSLKKKLKEQEKMIKLKEQSEEKVKKLNDEIRLMKQTRIRLLKQLKEDSDKFNQWKQQKDREVAQLKRQDRKRQYELVKMERMHSKQQNVLRRKMEEATAANKRLKDALSKRATIVRPTTSKEDPQTIANKIKGWLSEELELVASTREASHQLEQLIQDRKIICEELEDLKRESDDDRPPRKKSMENGYTETHSDLEQKISNLEDELDMRNLQIEELQQKLLDASQEDKSTSSRWDTIQNMMEAKCALKWLFNVAAEKKFEQERKTSEQKELLVNYEETVKCLEKSKFELANVTKRHADETNILERTHEEKVLFLLQQMPKTETSMVTDEELLKRLEFQEREIERLSSIQNQLEHKTAECDELKKQLTLSSCKGRKTTLMPVLKDFDGSPVGPPARRAMAKPKTKLSSESAKMFNDDAKVNSNKPVKKRSSSPNGKYSENPGKKSVMDLSTDDDFDYDDPNDPDWRGTPLHLRTRSSTNLKKVFPFPRPSSTGSDENVAPSTNKGNSNKTTVKSETLKCKCKFNCISINCSCRKSGNICSDSCACGDTCSTKVKQEVSVLAERKRSGEGSTGDLNQKSENVFTGGSGYVRTTGRIKSKLINFPL